MYEENLKLEKIHLSDTVKDLGVVITDTKHYLDRLPSLHYDEYTLSYQQYITNNKINSLEKSLLRPYFARIDYIPIKHQKEDKYYIGKIGAMDSKGNPIIIDWRAPISTLYYDSNIGSVSYQAPDKIEYGELMLKRQFNIENSELLSFTDVDTVANDDLLKPYLGVNADNRLKNIVASIQSEQNAIIRKTIGHNLIVQGVAGSGKTTVALHRIAYLVYNYHQIIKPKQYMIIGPNKFFINYISAVLPDLDVNDVPEYTLGEITKKYLNEKFDIREPSVKLVNVIENNYQDNISSFKTSLNYKNLIDKFIDELELNLLTYSDVKIENYILIRKEELRKIYYEFKGEDNIKAKIDRLIIYFGREIQRHSEKIYNTVVGYIENNYNDHDIKVKKQLWLKNEIKDGCKNILKKYFSKVDTKIIPLYKEFITNIGNYINDEILDIIKLKDITLSNINKRIIDFEDIPALIYLKYRVKGSEEFNKYKHIVIDEAQDFGIFHFYALKKLNNEATFSIFGDLAQSIYENYSIKDWEEVINNVFDNRCEKININKSYRTTIEIMNAANKINNYLNLNEAIPVIRHGEMVTTRKTNDVNHDDYLLNRINSFKEKGYKSIAIICKNLIESQKIYNALRNKIKIEMINDKNELYDGGVCILTSYLAKGLEFDAVIINNADTNTYNLNSRLEMKLLYVAMTRPLHELEILYKENLISILND